jgi:hypothetical protein
VPSAPVTKDGVPVAGAGFATYEGIETDICVTN